MRGKRYNEEKKQLGDKTYPLSDALDLITKSNKLGFDPSVEVSIKLAIDPGKSEQNVRGVVEFPNPTGKSKKVAAFVTPEKEKDAKEAGADIVGGEDLVQEIKKSEKTDFDIAVAEPAAMKLIGQVAKILGPRGLMPNPKDGTVTPDIGKEIESIKAGKVSFKNDDGGNLHMMIGKLSLGSDKLEANAKAFIDAVKRSKPDAVKVELISKIVISTAQGPGVNVSA